MYAKRIPIELTVTTAGDPCNPVDGVLFIWTSMTGLYAGTKGAWKLTSKKTSMEKREDEATNCGGGIVRIVRINLVSGKTKWFRSWHMVLGT